MLHVDFAKTNSQHQQSCNMDVNLCSVLIQVFFEVRPAFSRLRTAHWAALLVLGFCIRRDTAGVTSFVRAFGFRPNSYQSLLDSFSSCAVKLDTLNQLWLKLCLKIFNPVRVQGRIVLACDGIKAPREGRRMPSVKLCHQSSTNNSKPEFVMAHSMQMLSLLVESFGNKISAVLLSARIHEGLIFSNRDHRTLLDKMNAMVASTLGHEEQGFLLVADAYYSSAALLDSMAAQNGAMLVRVRNNAVGYLPAVPSNKPTRGRPKKYGKRIVISDLFKAKSAEFETISSPIRDEEGIMTRYLVIDLLWKQLKEKVRFILSDHPTRGQCILMTNEWNLKPEEAIRLYHARFGIEMSFKALVHTVGGFDYHFWMKDMDKLKRGDGDQYPHRKDEKYREKIKAKVNAYHVFVNLAAIAQGILCYLAIAHKDLVWQSFGSWMRTIRKDLAPSEAVTSEALRESFSEYLQSTEGPLSFKKFLAEKSAPCRSRPLRQKVA
jgi:hypothetical protein